MQGIFYGKNAVFFYLTSAVNSVLEFLKSSTKTIQPAQEQSSKTEVIECSRRKSTWHGIICCHIICVKRTLNMLDCAPEEFNKRWFREHAPSASANVLYKSNIESLSPAAAADYGEEERVRYGMLMSVAKNIVVRSVGEYRLYTITSESLLISALERTVIEMSQLMEADGNGNDNNSSSSATDIEENDYIQVRNPFKLRVQTKGRPRTGKRRLESITEVQRTKKRSVKCGNCGIEVHNARRCPQST